MPNNVDDGSIPDGAGLLRRIRPDQVVDDKNLGRKRPSSGAFKADNMSVDAEPLLHAQGLDWRFTLNGYPDFSLVRFPARTARENGQAVVHKPIAGNIAHTEVIGKKSQGIANRLVDAAEWVHIAEARRTGS